MHLTKCTVKNYRLGVHISLYFQGDKGDKGDTGAKGIKGHTGHKGDQVDKSYITHVSFKNLQWWES